MFGFGGQGKGLAVVAILIGLNAPAQAGETVGVYLFYAARSEHTAAERERIAELLRREYNPPRSLSE